MQVSAVQSDVTLGDADANLRTLQRHVAAEAAAGSQLIVFPECFATGYCYRTPAEAARDAQPVDGPFTDAVIQECRKHDCCVVFGLVEKSGAAIRNTAVLVGPDGVIDAYRKVHLPWLGVDRFTTPGDQPFRVVECRGVRVGLLICYDVGFPEAARALALDGVELILLPTNWPPGAEQMAEYTINTRAMENSIYFLAANRVGSERGFHFIGQSRICDPAGRTITSADHTEECVLRAEINPEEARTKRYVRVPGEHMIDRFADRRPEMYQRLCDPHSLPRPGRDEEAV